MRLNREKRFLRFRGRLDSVNGVGVNILIRKGATLVTSPNDIIGEFPELQKLKEKIVKDNVFIKKEYRKIYNILNDIPITLDEISMKTRKYYKMYFKFIEFNGNRRFNR